MKVFVNYARGGKRQGAYIDTDKRKCTTPTKCRSCGAEILWVTWPSSGKKMPVDSPADMRPVAKGGGSIVLGIHGGEYGELHAEKYDPSKHHESRNRYTSHFATCPNATQHRKEK